MFGTVASYGFNAINLDYLPVSDTVNDTLVIGSTGVVSSMPNCATIILAGNGNLIANAGTVMGGLGLWLENYGGGSVINSRLISGIRFGGIRLLAGANTVITNSGMVEGVTGVSLLNSTGHIYNSGI